jgi:adenylate cyclase
MNASGDQRRLSAILAADMVGYTKRMEYDSEGTVTAWKATRTDIIDPSISRFSGRIVKLTGDGFLAEFHTVIDAVNCAIAMQSDLSTSALDFRMGINLGDIIDDGEDIHGEGVNLAARIESLADSGGISISSSVYEQVLNRLEHVFEDMGEVEVKNVSRPVRVYRIILGAERDRLSDPLIPAELIQDKTISISSFENLSSAAEIGYFCEGVAEDIATALGNIAQLTVVSDEHRIDDDSTSGSAHFLLTGKVRSSGNRLRISAQLIDRQTGVQRWADRFDRDVENLFEVQDDVTRNIVIGVHSELGAGAYTNQWQWGTENLEAWELMAKGFREFQKFSPDSMVKTAATFEQALAKDPNYLAPLMGNGYCYSYLALIFDGEKSQSYLVKAQKNFEQALARAPNDVRTYSARREIEIARENYDEAVAAAQYALDLEPNNAACRGTLAMTLSSADKPRDALAQANKAALEMSDPPGWLFMTQILSHYALNNSHEALRIAREIVSRTPDFYPGPVLNAALAAELGMADETSALSKKVLEVDPHFSAQRFVRSLGLKSRIDRGRLFKAIVDAGLPE